MPFAAYGDGKSIVNTIHNACVLPVTTTTLVGSSNVLVNGIKACKTGDLNLIHNVPVPGGCGTHSTALTAASPSVFVNGEGMGRIGDTYSCSAMIITGSTNIRVN